MQGERKQPRHQELKQLVVDAAQSLAKLDVNRLEELALSCQALNNDPSQENRQALVKEARAAKRGMTVLAKVLEATRANAAVMARLRKMHESRMEYSASRATQMREPEAAHGDN